MTVQDTPGWECFSVLCDARSALRRNPPDLMIRSFRGKHPQIAPSAYVDPSAQVVGDVVLGERSSVWLNVSIRGDVNSVCIGNETSIQDNTVLHVDSASEFRLTIGDRVTVGHRVVLHGCTIENDALIGIGAIVLNGARIGAGAVVAAGALVTEGMQVAAGTLVMGAPAKPRRAVTAEEQERFRKGVAGYVEKAAIYRDEA
ncbi:MAG TPA: gamma carbonic anhydrase family protein [Phototrophicaceae bacterium]|nr:gamma carbonic anhydrase family protein [Phototrophicaceae bacterium]